MRSLLVIGNWKLNGNTHTAHNLILDIRKETNNILGCDIVIAPPTIYLYLVSHDLKGSKIFLGAQNVDIHLSGAYTGEVSANMLKDIGAKYIIIGHSERRNYHKENNKFISQKFAILKNVGLIPVLCIGENKEEYEAGRTKMVCIDQINAILYRLNIEAFADTVIAYEPIWAIGTGKSATPSQVQIIHKFIRNYISQYNATIAKQVIILYGGSVNTSNAKEFFIQPDIDGVLIGNASLQAKDFGIIVKAAANII